MPENAHTPGPWTARNTADSAKVDESRYRSEVRIGGVQGHLRVGVIDACSVADLRLILAAPDLLAACESALAWVASNTPMVDDADPVLGPVARSADAVRAKLRAAIQAASATH
jgi:hypothetical protein